MTGMTLAKATKEDFRIMWSISRQSQNLQWAGDRTRARRCKMVIVGRLDQLGTGGFMRIVMGCEMMIRECCDPAVDHYALKPVLGAAPELLAALQLLYDTGADNPLFDYARSRASKAIVNTTGSPT